LLDSPDRQFIRLKGFNFEDVQDLIEFMYKGEVRIEPERLEDMHHTGTELKVFGFVDEDHPIEQQVIKVEKVEEKPQNDPPFQPGLVRNRDGFLCLQCKKTIKRKPDAERHFRESHLVDKNKKNIPCPICEEKFHIRRYMQTHMRLKHGINQKMFKDNFTPETEAKQKKLGVKQKKLDLKTEPED